jgi:TRAP-type transport system small permease protein
MMLLTASDVVMRYFFNKPIIGSFELTEYLMALIVAFTIAYSAANDGLIKVTLLTERLSEKTRSIIDLIAGIPCIALVGFIAWRGFVFIGLIYNQHLSSPILAIPRYPFAGIVAFGLTCLVLVLILDWLHTFVKVVKK